MACYPGQVRHWLGRFIEVDPILMELVVPRRSRHLHEQLDSLLVPVRADKLSVACVQTPGGSCGCQSGLIRRSNGRCRLAAVDVFISYAAEDRDIVQELAVTLQSYGLEIWFDQFRCLSVTHHFWRRSMRVSVAANLGLLS